MMFCQNVQIGDLRVSPSLKTARTRQYVNQRAPDEP